MVAPVVAVAPPRPEPGSLVIVNYPAPVLRKRAEEVGKIDEWLRGVVARMKMLMVEHAGVGLAGPQVNVPLRVFVWAATGKLEDVRAIINPVVSQERGSVEGEEGCLSLGEIRTKVVRYQGVHLAGVDENGAPVVVGPGGVSGAGGAA